MAKYSFCSSFHDHQKYVRASSLSHHTSTSEFCGVSLPSLCLYHSTNRAMTIYEYKFCYMNVTSTIQRQNYLAKIVFQKNDVINNRVSFYYSSCLLLLVLNLFTEIHLHDFKHTFKHTIPSR